MANDAATLNGYLDSALRDPSNLTWTSGEKDLAIARAVRNLSPKIVRAIDWEDTDHSDTLVAGTYYYTLEGTMLHVSRIDMVDADDTERGPLRDGTWEVVGDIIGGSGKVHIAPFIVDNNAGSTVWYRGYGAYDVATHLIPDDYIELVISTAAMECIKMLLADRSRFLQQGNTRQDQVVSITELVTMLNAFEQSAREKKSTFTTFRKPVPGRV